MNIKIISEDDFNQKGCSAIPENDLENDKEDAELKELLEKIELEKNNLLEKETIEKATELQVFADKYIKEKVCSDNFENESIAKLYDHFKRENERLEKITKTHEENEEYLNKDMNTAVERYKILDDEYKESVYQRRETTKEISNLIYEILIQLHEGVLIGDLMTVRKDGVYPYKCRYRMDSHKMIDYLIKYKDDVIENIKSKDKLDMINCIYAILETLDKDLICNGYGYSSRLTESTELIFSNTYIHPLYEEDYETFSLKMLEIKGILLSSDDDIRFLIDEKREQYENKHCSARIDDSNRDYLIYKFYDIIKKLYRKETSKELQLSEFIKRKTEMIRDRGSKFLIISSFNEELQNKLKRNR